MSKLALKLIAENKTKHAQGEDAQVLDLGNCGLTELPEEALECIWVEELILSSEWYDYDPEQNSVLIKSQNEGPPNNIATLPLNISKMQGLQKLIIRLTKISDLSPLIGLENMEILYCTHTQVSDLVPLAGLINLKELLCSETKISDLSPIAQLVNLKELSCGATQVSDLSPIAELVNLQILSFDSTQVSDLSPLAELFNLQKLTFSSTQVSDLSPLAKLSNLKELNCYSTQVSDLSPLAKLSNLKGLSCYSTQVSDLSPIAKLSNLQYLEVSFTKLSDISPVAAFHDLKLLSFQGIQVSDLAPLVGLSNLEMVYCSGTLVTDLSPIQFLLKKGIETRWQDFGEFDDEKPNAWKERPVILIKDCPLTHPPVEIAKQGTEAILRYFEEMERLEKSPEAQPALIKVREAKVLIVGQGKSGKTTLRRKLENPEAEMPAPGDTTRGIEITRLDERMPHSGEALKLNLWDFGGQDIQHYAHQFFLTGSSLYALVTNERIQDSVHLPYWLNIIEMLGKKSPVILIQNKDGGHCQVLKDEAAIRARFANVHNKVFQSDFSMAKTETEFAALRKKIVELASELPHIEKEYLRSFHDLRLKLEAEAALEKHYLRWFEYLELMPELSEDLMRDYANALTFLGVCQYFPDDAMLSEYVFLRPKWLIDALFELLLHPSLDATRGLFLENDTREIWKAPEYRGMHALLVRMLKEFELCYRVEGDEEKFIVPQRLPGENKMYGWNPESDVPVQFRYKFMPKGILTRLICRLHPRIEDDPVLGQRVWNDAVIFTLPDKKGRVFAREVYSENTIELRATGEKHAEMLNEVIRKMDDINTDAKYDNLQVEKMVPCPCVECAEAEAPGFHEFDALQKRIDKGKTTSECKKSGDDVLIEEIFGKSGVKKPQARRGEVFSERKMHRQTNDSERGKPSAKIFISYSKDDEHHKDTLLRHLSGLRGKVVTWHDQDILPGEDWDDNIKTALHEADIVLYLVTHNSISTEYIYKVELPIIEQRCVDGTCILVPIIVDFCVWTELDFAKHNALPEKGASVSHSKWKNENEAWVKVIEGVQRILAARRERN